jgi:hypothetical protein
MTHPATLQEPARTIPVVAEAEVVVLGGGPAGIAAATAAAQTGASTLLLERYGFLGGMGTAAMVTNFCGLHAGSNGEVSQVVHGVADDILDRLRAIDGLAEPHVVQGPDGLVTGAQAYDTAAFKEVADAVVTGAGASIRFHTFACGAIMEAGRIQAVLIETKSGRGAIRGETFIDCSGDADLAQWAGAPTATGSDDGFIAYPTLMFRIAGVDDARAMNEARPNLRALIAEANESGRFTLPRKAGIMRTQAHAGEWRANLTQISRDGQPLNGADADDLSYAEQEGRKQVREYFNFLKEMAPGFEKAYLLETAPQIGIRETRRILGDVQLSGDDVLTCRDFDDAVGVNGWPLETHEFGDVAWRYIPGRGYCQIPFSTTIPKGVENLLVAGRCASTTQDGQASLRVSGPCFVMGQAAGTASALGLKTGTDAKDVPIRDLQRQLVQDGAYLGHVPGL